MILPMLLSAAMLFPTPWSRAPSETSLHKVGRWSLEVRLNRFSGRATCRLTNGNVSIVRGVVIFRFPKTVDTVRAVYRIDDGAPTDVSADTLALAQAGLALYSDDLRNPSGGLVRVPAPKLLDAQTIKIAPSPEARPVTFNVFGVRDAIERARLADCPSPISSDDGQRTERP